MLEKNFLDRLKWMMRNEHSGHQHLHILLLRLLYKIINQQRIWYRKKRWTKLYCLIKVLSRLIYFYPKYALWLNFCSLERKITVEIRQEEGGIRYNKFLLLSILLLHLLWIQNYANRENLTVSQFLRVNSLIDACTVLAGGRMFIFCLLFA